MNGENGVSGADLRKRYEAAFMPNYGVPPLALASGAGCRVRDHDGREYLDLIAGIAVTSLGHGHPALAEAVAAQAARLAHTSNLFVNEPEVLLAEKLRELLGGDGRVFLANSGTEANECALKLALKYGRTHGRSYFVAAENGFHGRSMGALSLTGKRSIREPFGPYALDVRFVPYGDADALKAAVTGDCAAVFGTDAGRGRLSFPRRTGTSPPYGTSATRPAPCSSPTRSSRPSAAPGPGSPSSTRTPGPTC